MGNIWITQPTNSQHFIKEDTIRPTMKTKTMNIRTIKQIIMKIMATLMKAISIKQTTINRKQRMKFLMEKEKRYKQLTKKKQFIQTNRWIKNLQFIKGSMKPVPMKIKTALMRLIKQLKNPLI